MHNNLGLSDMLNKFQWITVFLDDLQKSMTYDTLSNMDISPTVQHSTIQFNFNHFKSAMQKEMHEE